MKIPFLFIPLAAASVLMAQTPAPNQPESKDVQHSAKARGEEFVQRLTERLNLTPDQHTHVKAIFKDSRAESKDLRMKLRQEHQELTRAIRNDSEGQIDQITHQNADVMARLQAIHEKAMAKVYSLLTPEQRTKFNKADWRANRAHQHAGSRQQAS